MASPISLPGPPPTTGLTGRFTNVVAVDLPMNGDAVGERGDTGAARMGKEEEETGGDRGDVIGGGGGGAAGSARTGGGPAGVIKPGTSSGVSCGRRGRDGDDGEEGEVKVSVVSEPPPPPAELRLLLGMLCWWLLWVLKTSVCFVSMLGVVAVSW